MRTSSLLRKLGWKQSKGKWINDEGHSKPLTLKQAQNALARDYGAKNFDSFKSKGKLKEISDIVDRGYKPAGKGKFKAPKGRKEYSPKDLSEKIKKEKAKEERKLFEKRAKDAGFKSSKGLEKARKYAEDEEGKYDYFRGFFDEDDNDDRIKKLVYDAFKAPTKAERQRALDRLLREAGLRTGNEPWPAGQTPRMR